MNSTDRHDEVEQLDHQRARLEELLASERLSQDCSRSLRRLLEDVTSRILRLKSPQPSGQGR